MTETEADIKPNCMSIPEIKKMLSEIEEAFHGQDVERLAADFAEDIVIRFADLPEIQGKKAAKKWLASRFKRQQGYRLIKTFKAVTGDIIGGSWTGEWTDSQTGRLMQGKGMEFLTMQDGKISVWDAVFNTWEKGSKTSVPVT